MSCKASCDAERLSVKQIHITTSVLMHEEEGEGLKVRLLLQKNNKFL